VCAARPTKVIKQRTDGRTYARPLHCAFRYGSGQRNNTTQVSYWRAHLQRRERDTAND